MLAVKYFSFQERSSLIRNAHCISYLDKSILLQKGLKKTNRVQRPLKVFPSKGLFHRTFFGTMLNVCMVDSFHKMPNLWLVRNLQGNGYFVKSIFYQGNEGHWKTQIIFSVAGGLLVHVQSYQMTFIELQVYQMFRTGYSLFMIFVLIYVKQSVLPDIYRFNAVL